MGPEILIAGERAHRGELVPRVQDLGYTVVPVRERELVRRAAQSPGPAAVIVCLGGPEAGALVQALRESPETAALPVLLYGRLQGETRDLAAVLELGADRFLEAPVDEAELKAALAELAGPPEVSPRPEIRTDPSLPPRPTRADPVLSRLHDTLAALAARLETREESVDGQRDGIDLEAMGLDAVPDVDPEHDSGELELLREPTQRLPSRTPSRGTVAPKASAPLSDVPQPQGELTFSGEEEISPEPPPRTPLPAHDEPTALVVTSAREDVRKARVTRWGARATPEAEEVGGPPPWRKEPVAGPREATVALGRERLGEEPSPAGGRRDAEEATVVLRARQGTRPGDRGATKGLAQETGEVQGEEAAPGRFQVGSAEADEAPREERQREATVALRREEARGARRFEAPPRGEGLAPEARRESRFRGIDAEPGGRRFAALAEGEAPSRGAEDERGPRGGQPRREATEELSLGTGLRGRRFDAQAGGLGEGGLGRELSDEAPRGGRLRLDREPRREATEALPLGTGPRGRRFDEHGGGRFRVDDEERATEAGEELSPETGARPRGRRFEAQLGESGEEAPRVGRFRLDGEQRREATEALPLGTGPRGRWFDGQPEGGLAEELPRRTGDEPRRGGRFRVGDEERATEEELSLGTGARPYGRRFAGQAREGRAEELPRGTGDEPGRVGRFRVGDEERATEEELSLGTGGRPHGRRFAGQAREGREEELPRGTGDEPGRVGRFRVGREPRMDLSLGTEARGRRFEAMTPRAGRFRVDDERPPAEVERPREAGMEVNPSRAGRLRPRGEAAIELPRATGPARLDADLQDELRATERAADPLAARSGFGVPREATEVLSPGTGDALRSGRPGSRRWEASEGLSPETGDALGSGRPGSVQREASEGLSPETGDALGSGRPGSAQREAAGTGGEPGTGRAGDGLGRPDFGRREARGSLPRGRIEVPRSASERRLSSWAGGALEPLGTAAGRGEAEAPALLAELRRERFTGCLQVIAAGAPERRLWWSEGQVIGGASAAASESVLGRLQARGLLSAGQVELAARWGSGDPRRDVERLARSGMIKPQEMREALREPVRQIVERIAEAGAITWALYPGSQPEVTVELGVPLAALIAGGVQRGSTLAQLRAAVGDERRPRLAFAGPEALAAELRWPAVATITERFDGQTTVAALIAAAVADEAAIRGAVFVLELLGHLAPEIDDPEATLVALDRQRVRERLRLARESDYFALLGLPREASRAEVLRAHADLTATFCEGLEPASRAELAEELEELLAALDEARDVLADDALHSAYLAQIGAT